MALKEDYKKLTGKEWKPGVAPAQSAKEPAKTSAKVMSKPTDSKDAQELKARIDAQGAKVRELKTGGGSKVRSLVNMTLFITYHCFVKFCGCKIGQPVHI